MCLSLSAKNDPVFSFPCRFDLRLVCLSVFSSPGAATQWSGHSLRADSLFLWMSLAAFSIDAGFDVHHRSSKRSLHGTAGKRSRGLYGWGVDTGLPGAGIDHARAAPPVSQAPLGTPLAAGRNRRNSDPVSFIGAIRYS